MIDVDALVGFIRARNEEDRALAQAATAGPWTHNAGKAWFPDPDLANRLHAGGSYLDEPKLQLYAQIGDDEYARARLGEEFVKAGISGAVAITGPADDAQSMADARYIAAQNPAVVLALADAADALLAWATTDPIRGELVDGCDYGATLAMETAQETVLRHLAGFWRVRADGTQHPDWQEDWTL